MRKRALGLAVALIVGAFVVSASGAATTKGQKVSTIDVSTRAAVIHYLHSIHVNAKHAVIQRGFRNYAGAHCPGTHWTCANTKHTVVQIAKRGGQNRFLCKSSKCVVVQISGTSHGVYLASRTTSATGTTNKGGNSGYCVKTGSGTLSGGGQTCSIIQTATGTGANMAGIYEVTSKVSGLVQTVQWAATIKQTSSSGNNTACVTQGITMDGSTSNTNTKGVSVSLEATQSIAILQNSSSGANSAVNGANPTTGTCSSQTLSQSQTETSTVTTNGNVTQTLNPAVNSTIPNGGNASLDIEQNQATGFKGSATGANSAVFSQTTNQTAIANTKSGAAVTQQENQPDGDGTTVPFSGIVGTVNQDSTGQSTSTVTQSETQCEDASTTSTLTGCSQATSEATPTGFTSLHPLTQTENGPVGLVSPAQSPGRIHAYHKGIGTSAQTGTVAGSGVKDSFTLHQHSFQYSDKPDPNLNVTVHQLNTMEGDCTSSGDGLTDGGSCAADQSATLNSGNGSGTTSDGYTAGQIGGTGSGAPPPLVISCDNGHLSCKPTPPPKPTLTQTPPVNTNGETNSTSATFKFTDPATSANFICILDGVVQPTGFCGSPTTVNGKASGSQTYTGFSFGVHTFQVEAADNFGNDTDPVPATAFTWTVVPPDPTITASSKPTNPDFFGTSDAFEFTDTADPNVDYKCTLDGNELPCNSGSITYTSTDLDPGSHTFSVQAFDTTDTYGSLNSATYTWNILPLSLFVLGTDGSSAGWECEPGGPIKLQVGTDPGTYAGINIENAPGTAIDGMTPPSFIADNYQAGSPRFVIELSNGHELIGYPGLSGLNGTDMAWSDSAIDSGNTYHAWSVVESFETGAGTTVSDAFVVADASQWIQQVVPNYGPDDISDLTFQGVDFNSATCP